MVTSKKHSEPQPGKRPPVEIHSITFQLSDPDNPPESLELDERFTFLRDYPSYQIQAGDRLFGFDKVETLKKSRQDLMTLIARWPKSCSTLVWACLNQSGILTQPSPHLPAECVMPSVWSVTTQGEVAGDLSSRTQLESDVNTVGLSFQ